MSATHHIITCVCVAYIISVEHIKISLYPWHSTTVLLHLTSLSLSRARSLALRIARSVSLCSLVNTIILYTKGLYCLNCHSHLCVSHTEAFPLSLSPPHARHSLLSPPPHLTSPHALPNLSPPAPPAGPSRATHGMSSMFGGGARWPPSPLPSELDRSVARLGLGLSTSTSMLRLLVACALAIDSTRINTQQTCTCTTPLSEAIIRPRGRSPFNIGPLAIVQLRNLVSNPNDNQSTVIYNVMYVESDS